ncbi:hypothetical protein ACIBI3_07025 [Actinomadura luteofluorescens]
MKQATVSASMRAHCTAWYRTSRLLPNTSVKLLSGEGTGSW